MKMIKQKGFTLVEILIVLFVVGIVLSMGFNGYRDYTRRQLIVGGARQLVSDIRLAQNESLSGNKPTGCNGSFERYNFVYVNPTQYQVQAVCSSSTVTVRTVTLPNNTQMNAFPLFSFKAIGQGTSIAQGGSITITISTTGTAFTQSVTINSAGDIR